MKTTAAEKRLLASQSLENSCKTPAFARIFPEYQDKLKQQKEHRQETGFTEPPAAGTTEQTEPRPEDQPAEVAEAAVAPGRRRYAEMAAVGIVAIAVGVAYAQYTLWSR